MKNRNLATFVSIFLISILVGFASCTTTAESIRPTSLASTTVASSLSPALPSSQPSSQASQGAQPAQSATPPQTTPNTLVPVPATTTTAISSVINSQAFPGNVTLGWPTDASLTLSLMSPAAADIFVQYGKASGKYESQTTPYSLKPDQPLQIQISGLKQATRYYYRICHRAAAASGFLGGIESTFITQRVPGEKFIFTVDADPHFDNNADPAKIRLSFQNILNDHPDFAIDLGDTFMTEKLGLKSYEQTAGVYLDRRSFFSIFGSSVPLYLVLGNHDGRKDWDIQARDIYFPGSLAGSFYNGTRNYYAWEWGGSLFVVLDPYSNTSARGAAGWDWTLGKEQYTWLKSTLENSHAKNKFVFTHHLVGGFDLGTNGNGRGGAEAARFYEWGGQNTDGTWGFDKNRPGWGKPVHQLLVDHHVTILFHGHDHFFGSQKLDDIVYQECPQPGSMNENAKSSSFGYIEGVFVGSPGYVRVSVSESTVTVDYVRTYFPGQEPAGHKNGEGASTYTVQTPR